MQLLRHVKTCFWLGYALQWELRLKTGNPAETPTKQGLERFVPSSTLVLHYQNVSAVKL
ncbi:hypothetical protein LYNGBM3L_63440 [Moorena producens 3L]|uniref:Uncharacterized protein n=1 Tax=Moorena producens 3L TaxID=489825 RepID=F4Y150_9CYAN|nr:hypothetical protein [Moorena producens 3L]EGJ29561.1 hypothetical protein LYNGBM3L_63440 [Moorena producens 3L]